jgi:uncharacterized protein (DUF2252 family)
MRDPIAEFMDYNRPFARRNPELLRFKVARMAQSPFTFFRGTFHLFARDVLSKALDPLRLCLGDGPEMDLVGDIHSENYGSFKAADGLVHYDVNDFDETTSGRFDFDVCRAAVSWLLAAHDRGDALADAVQTPLAGLATYTDALHRLLKKGRTPDLDFSETQPSDCGPVDDLVRVGAAARRPAFIGRLTEKHDGGRRIVRSTHFFNLSEADRAQAVRLLEDYRRRLADPRKDVKDYFKVEDVCGRVSGIGSMGRLRYLLLLNGKGSAEARNVLLEFKEARPSAYDLYRGRDADAAALAGRAERVIAVQRASQAVSSLRLGFAVDGGMSFQAREIGPPDARVDTAALKTPALLQGVVRVQAAVLARIHARAAMRAVGPANPLAELAEPEAFSQRVLAFALAYADVVRRDWTRFVGARADLDNVAAWAGPAERPG